MPFPREEYFSQSLHCSVACHSLCRMKPPGFSSLHFGMSIGVILIQFMCRQSYCCDFIDGAFDIHRRHSPFLFICGILLYKEALQAFFFVFTFIDWVSKKQGFVDKHGPENLCRVGGQLSFHHVGSRGQTQSQAVSKCLNQSACFLIITFCQSNELWFRFFLKQNRTVKTNFQSGISRSLCSYF